MLSFTAFATEDGYDYVRIFEGDEITGEPAWALTGTSLPEAVTVSGAALVVQFVFSDDTGPEDGFSADFACASACTTAADVNGGGCPSDGQPKWTAGTTTTDSTCAVCHHQVFYIRDSPYKIYRVTSE